ncbi:MAG: asparagine synthase (glutamine-hydrolyzing) [Lachnospiraceae bacterium]|jgi:asparagine synthase (glutamine-hydrolysing)|nr:asparagine synthase (glutamine-hydrolyzing) [Lachnospiraceae bacterium]
MSGIAGFYQCKYDFTTNGEWPLRLEKMMDSLLHRGPDGNGTHLESHAGFAQTRLATTLSTETLPLIKHIGDQTIMIAWCGELYNRKTLQHMLLSYSCDWDEYSDAEVIANGYLTMGCDFFRELNGMYAFAIYDKGLDRLILCRDRCGTKPLFFQQTEDILVFGSEPKALFAYGIRPRLNRESFGELFGLGPARTLGKGVYQDMKEVIPGHYLIIHDGQINDVIYWQLRGAPHPDSFNDTVATISYLVSDCIKRQTIADTPVACFLSGGLDSSLVSAVCAREMALNGHMLDTYSFDFHGNSEHFKANAFQSSQDRPYAELMVAHLKTNHTYLTCDTTTQADYLEKAVDAADLPCMGDIEASLLYFCEQVTGQNKIALTGEGADEIFGGYPWFHQESTLNESGFPWSRDMEFRTALLSADFLAQIKPEEYALKAYEQTKAETPCFEGDDHVAAKRRELSYLTMRWFMVTLLNRMDRTSMYSGLQARVPFGDHRLIEYLYNVPWEMKCPDGINKGLLIEAGRTLLPKAVLNRKKSPYPKTYDPAYEHLLGDRLRTVLSAGNSPLLGIVDRKKVEQFLTSPADYGKPWYGQLMAGPQMLAYLLQVDYWMKKYSL